MSDQEKRIKSMRRDLEGWREILVGLQSVLIWEKQYYPAITTSVLTFLFLLIWYIDPAVLTFFSLLGMTITLCDFMIPQVMPWVFGPNYWTGTHERKYEQIIISLASMRETCTGAISSLHSIKTSKPKTYFIIMTTFLLTCTWVGSSVNNLFLTYLIVLVAAMFPGLRRQGIMKKYFAVLMQNISKMLKGMGSPPNKESGEKSGKKE